MNIKTPISLLTLLALGSGAATNAAIKAPNGAAAVSSPGPTVVGTFVAGGFSSATFKGVAGQSSIGRSGDGAQARGLIGFKANVVLPLSDATSGAIINEFRLGGPNGASDEFIELYNQTSGPLNLSGWSVVAGNVTVPLPANLPAVPGYGRLLITGSGYSLSNYGGTNAASGDLGYAGDIASGATLALRNAADGIVDSVTFANLPAPTSATSNYSYVRRMDGVGGAPQDTGNDASDFNTVDVAATIGPNNTTGVSSGILRLGAPGPQNASSPIVANQLFTFTQTGFTRTETGNSGSLIVRGNLTNLSSRAVTALRLRAVGLTAGTTTGTAPADIRLATSTVSDGSAVPLALQVPPAQPNGGGLNASVSLGSGIAPGATVTVEFVFTIRKSGSFRYLFNLEPVTAP